MKASRLLLVLVTGMLMGGCSHSPLGSGSGGDNDVAGAMTGTAGTSGGDGQLGPVAPVGPACVLVRNLSPCDGSEPPCYLTCGPLKSGFRNCTCVSQTWSCDVCGYDPTLDYSCYTVSAATQACPRDPSSLDPSGAGIPQSGAACALPPCTPCGSATATAYVDATGTPKVGFCVCTADTHVYSCATSQSWPPTAGTPGG